MDEYYRLIPHIQSDKDEIGTIPVLEEVINLPSNTSNEMLKKVAEKMKGDTKDLTYEITMVKVFKIIEIMEV